MRFLGNLCALLLFGVVLLTGIDTTTTQAQQLPATCPLLVNEALTRLSDNCGALGRNTACYGHDDVVSTFYRPVEEGYFSHPSDTALLIDIQTISTEALDLAKNIWGMAVMNAQANVPGTIPGQGVTILLLGDATVENRVTPEEATLTTDTIELTAKTDAVVRDQPNREADVLAIVPMDATVMADAVDPSREWVRVLYEGTPAWMVATDIIVAEALSTLPVVTDESRSPMQAFYFSTGIGPIQCHEAPNVVTIQGHEEIVVNLNINGAEVRIGSTIDFRTIAPDQISVTVRKGHMEIVKTGNVVNAGETAIGEINSDATIIRWLGSRPATEEELNIGAAAQQALAYALGGQTNTSLALAEIIHIVSAGETLFGIGRQYEASMPAIVQRNGLDSSGTIYVDQTLYIPNPGSGFVALPVIASAQTALASTNTGVLDCTGFRATSPTEGLAYGVNTFYWDPVAGATGYRVYVTNNSSGRIISFDAPGTETSVTGNLDMQTIGGGYDFSWNVQAFVDGQPVCDSGQITTLRADPAGTTPPTAVPAAPAFMASWACSGIDVVVSYANAQVGEPILIEFTFNGSPVTLNATGPSGSVSFPVGVLGASNGKVTGSTSGQVTLSPAAITCP